MLRGIIITIFQPSRVSTLTIRLEWEVGLQESDLSSTKPSRETMFTMWLELEAWLQESEPSSRLINEHHVIISGERPIKRKTYHVSICNHIRRNTYHLIIMLYVIIPREIPSCLISSKNSLASHMETHYLWAHHFLECCHNGSWND